MPSKKKARGRKNRAKKEATRTADLRSQWEPTILARTTDWTSFHPANTNMSSSAYKSRGRARPGGRRRTRSGDGPAAAIPSQCIRPRLCQGGGALVLYQRTRNEPAICCMIYLLELLGAYSALAVVARRAAKMGNKLVFGNRRDVVKFVAKRLPCTCLKELHRAARKKVGKVGRCSGCKKRFPRSVLSVCTGCMMVEYCSKECQRADLQDHKKYCGYPELMSRDLPSDASDYIPNKRGCHNL
ncbi:hypothetical protein THAOC_21250 [Thalassiosira oceanica]|uniref:MYND-type domain-containing protein n=1 Tax=Thalassiosira oceanica TaxID=159749 RepID=K0RXV4_THAOC|nr:hypothetical protein THAOC_21250 [Thalassiosira oceanica]|eukprot:EJK58613.1 hypothetical protein THAOC_21250 [Thalassiosira oceanica]